MISNNKEHFMSEDFYHIQNTLHRSAYGILVIEITFVLTCDPVTDSVYFALFYKLINKLTSLFITPVSNVHRVEIK